MTSGVRGVKDGGRRGVIVSLVLVGGATAGLLWAAWPRPRPPEVPALRLDLGELAVQEAERRARFPSAPPEGEAVRRFEAAFREQGRAEAVGREAPGRGRMRLAELRRFAERIVDRHGERALLRLREAAVDRYAALWHRHARGEPVSREELAALVGAFGRMLSRYGLTRGDELLAPAALVRILYRARWNALAGRPLTWGLSEAERAAYHGWLAFHGRGADPELRLRALRAFARLRGVPWPGGGAVGVDAVASRIARDVQRARVALLTEAGREEEALALAHGLLLLRRDVALRDAAAWLEERVAARSRAARRPAPSGEGP